MKALAILAGALTLGGCASDAIRPTASVTMRLSQDLKTELTAFAARQNVEIQARRKAITVLDENTAMSAFMAHKQVLDWRSADNKAALGAYEQAISLPIGTQLAGRTTSGLFAPETPERRVAFDPQTYDALIKTLKPLAEKRSAIEDAKILLQYGQTVVDGMAKDLAEAAEAPPSVPAAQPAQPPEPESGNDG